MGSKRVRVFVTSVAAVTIGIYAEIGFSSDSEKTKSDPVDLAVAKGLKWLVSVQGKDGGWGQDGGETSYVREGERLESNGNDVANTAVVAEALLQTGTTMTRGEYREPLRRAVDFVLKHVEQSPAEGLAVTDQQGTQIQRKLGPYIDTFVTSKLLAELDGTMSDAKANARVRQDLQKCVAKIEKAQLKDGSWNISGGWAPILGTSMASQSLAIAQSKGAANAEMAMARVDAYTLQSAVVAAPSPTVMAGASASDASGVYSGSGAGSGGGIGSGSGGGVGSAKGGGFGPGSTASTVEVSAVSAGIPLYKKAQELEQLSRTEKDRQKNAKQIQEITGQLSDSRFVTGFGSIGGEEFFSYLNISESLRRTGGPEWKKWQAEMTAKLLKMQNEDGTWAGHHCITGRVAVTSAAILLLTADRERAPIVQSSKTKQ
ncbi:MAG TPA: prenyltransferase/squalene oxidase repeat-containing protein [Bryobacteraceae bacterium]|nr:prenyltransferase/squalene oxidase repeat-containing protein [Bryobacteraceae bacterium]